MKPDGATMETTDPTEAAAVAEPSNPPDTSTEQAPRPPEQPAATAEPPNTESSKCAVAKPKSTSTPTRKKPLTKTQPALVSKPGITSRQPVNDVRPARGFTSRAAPVKKPPAPSAKPPGAATVPKKTLGSASGNTSTARPPVRVPDKKPSEPVAASVTNGTKAGADGAKKTLAATKPRTAVPLSRPAGPAASKTGASTSTKPNIAAPKTSRPATAPTSRPAAKPITAAVATKLPSSNAKTLASRAATAPSSGRVTAAQSNKPTAPAKKEIRQPLAAAAAVTTKLATASAGVKKVEVSSPAANLKSSKTSTKNDPKPQQSIKPNASRKPAAVAARFPAVTKIQTLPGSSTSKALSPARSKQALKPTQAVTSVTAGKRAEKMGSTKAAATATTTAALNNAGSPTRGEVSVAVPPLAAASGVKEKQDEDVAPLLQAMKLEAAEMGKQSVADQSALSEPGSDFAPQSPEKPVSQCEPSQLDISVSQSGEPISAGSLVSLELTPQPEVLNPEIQASHLLKPAETSENSSHEVNHPNLNEDEEEEEKEGSQLVSVSEMSGTTQPTEESRPGSAGLVGASPWRAGGALHSELDSEEVSVSQQGASELSAPGVLEGTESMDDLGEGSLKGAMDIEGASAGSPDFEKVPEIPVNDYDEDEEEEDDNDRVCDMDVGSERADEPQRLGHDNDVDDEDEDVEMASEGVTESGLESYGNPDEDDFAEDERLDNLNRVAQPPPPPPLLPSAPAAQWDQPNPFTDPWAERVEQQSPPERDSDVAPDSPSTDPCLGDSETPTEEPVETWIQVASVGFTGEQCIHQTSSGKNNEPCSEPQMFFEEPGAAAAEPITAISPSCALGASPVTTGNGAPEYIDHSQTEKAVVEPQSAPIEEDVVPPHAPASNPSSSSVTEDEASDMEGEAQLEDSLEPPNVCNVTFECQPQGQRCLSTVEESEEPEDSGATPISATSQVSHGFDNTTSVSNAQSSAENCVRSPGIFSLEELSEDTKGPPAQPIVLEQPYIECGKGEADCERANNAASSDKICSASPEPQQSEQMNPLADIQPPYFSAICEKTENSFAGFSSLLHPQRRDHSSYPRSYCDIVKPVNAALASPKLTCADLPPRSPKQVPLSPQLRRLEQHQRHLLELQQRREQQSRPLEEAEQERKRREEEEERRKKDEAEEEIKRNKEQERKLQEEESGRREREQRKMLELQLRQQQEELKQRQQIMIWQQELQESSKGQPLLLSPSSGLCTIYEALENSDIEDDGVAKCGGTVKELNSLTQSSETGQEVGYDCGRVTPVLQSTHDSQNVQQGLTPPTRNGGSSPKSPDRPLPLDLDWGKKADIVHQLINQTLLLNGDGCASLMLLPGGAGGTLSPLESSLWPSLLPPLTPPSATVTSVSSFSPETSGSSSQGEWTVVELETHH